MYYNFFNALNLAALLILGSAWLFDVQGQDNKTFDSLLQVLNAAKGGKQVMDAKVELAWYCLGSRNEEALKYSTEGQILAKQFGDSAQIVKSGRIMGLAVRSFGKLQESIDILVEVLPIARRNGYRSEYKKILNGLAISYTYRAEYDRALEYHFQNLVLCEEEGDVALMTAVVNNIGFVYFKLKNYPQAIKYYTRSLELKRQIGNRLDLDLLLINIGLCHNQLGNFLEARKYFQEGFEACEKKCRDDILIQGKFGLGVTYFQEKEYRGAEGYFLESYELAVKNNNVRWKTENLVYLGNINTKLENFDKAKEYFLEAERNAKPGGYSQLLIDTYLHISLLFNELKDYAKASEYQQKYIVLKDSLFNENLVKNIAKVQTSYEERENIATIADRDIRLSQQRMLNSLWVVIAFITGLLVLVLQIGNRNIKRVNAKLSEAKEVIQLQNDELENKNRELDIEVDKKTIDLARVNQSLKQVNDELDNFIYKTSHDIRGPLASLKGMCNVALMDVKDPIALEYLRKLDATAERLNSILTRLVIINQINNSKISVEQIDFKAIVSEVLLLEKKKGLPSDLKITTFIDPQATIESDRELVRIVLENLIDNAIKFYNDSERVDSFMNVHISRVDNGNVKVRVIDNGIGISESSPGKLFQMFSRASERSETGGIGLYITKTAVEKIGGKIGLLTTPEGYTEFYVILPTAPYQEWEKLISKQG